jgi:hypothetical protein
MGTMSKKDVIYLDVEDDITAVIDKVKASTAAIIALVPPKRANMLSSVVNLRLLKRAADSEDKKVVLITDEQVLTSMAGGIGMFVATNLTSAPQIPKVNSVDLPSDVIDVDPSDIPEPTESKPTHEALAGATAVAASTTTDSKPKAKKSKSKVPDINRFRKFIFLGIGVFILLLVGLWWAYFVAPRADVTLTAQTTNLALDTPVTLSTDAEEVDAERNIIPAEQRETSKDVSEEFDATGEKDVGEKASGQVVFNNCESLFPVSVAAGTTITAGGKSYKTLEGVQAPGGTGDFGGCTSPGESAPVSVEAVENGSSYNKGSGTSFSVSGHGSDFTATSSGSISGGTNKVVSVVAASDVKDAQESASEDGKKEAIDELKAQFDDEELIIIEESIDTKRSSTTVTPGVGKEADTATLKETITYSMLAIQREDYEAFLDEKLDADLEKEQKIVDYDEKDVRFEKEDDAFTVIARPKAGPDIDLDALAEKLAGKRFSEAIAIAEDEQDVTEAKVRLRPFWVFSVPGNPEKITITIESPEN